ncbi:YdeI/OmpD-associated family protein [Pedobacter yonginense]|nr:YdeI/OmpD-associated family protein [Pedobacter yonginense]
MQNLFLKKLQIKPNFVVKVENAPENASDIFGEIPNDVTFNFDGSMDFDAIITFSTSKKQLHLQIEGNLSRIHAKTIFWVFSPKKNSKIETDLDLMKTWKELEVFGLAPCASAAVNEIWTGLRLKLISEVKPSGMRNDHIKTNEFGAYIDTENKKVKLPEDLSEALIPHQAALNYFNDLAYSHQKEYVLWILSAKQEKTRNARVNKALEMLLSGKKNPSVK